MYKMLVVDDEFSIREGLKAFDWASIGVEIPDMAENGLVALWKLQQMPYDLVLTDIRMPILDGLELVKQVARDYPSVAVVVLTVHSDFENVRTCLRNKVADFFIKPVEQEELVSSMKAIIERMDKVKKTRERDKNLDWRVGVKIRHLRHDFIREIFERPMSKEALLENADYCEILLEGDKFTIGFLEPDKNPLPLSNATDSRKLAWFGLDRILFEAVEGRGYGYHYVDFESFECCIIFTNAEIQGDRQKLSNAAIEIRNCIYTLNNLIGSSYSWGIGQTVEKVTDIYGSAVAAKMSLWSDHSKNSIVFLEHFEKQVHIKKTEEEVILQEPVDDLSGNLIVSKALAYIHEHYIEHISLADIANHVYIHPGYLSMLFKKITGKNFSFYLMEYRILKAKELLKDPANKVAQVARMVGYEDAAYFTRIFKQLVSSTPFEYKNSQ